MSIVEDFQNILKNKYHSCSYVFYGKSDQYKAYGFATWSKKTDSFYKFNKIYPKPIDREKKVGGVQINSTTFKDYYNYYILPDPNVEGDGTVPFISGIAPKGKKGVQCIRYLKTDHQGAYNTKEAQLFSLWSIVQIVKQVPCQ